MLRPVVAGVMEILRQVRACTERLKLSGSAARIISRVSAQRTIALVIGADYAHNWKYGTDRRSRASLHVIIILAASFAEFFVRSRLVVGGNAPVTATNILAHEQLYRSGDPAVLTYLPIRE